jgi:hypothetical protein
MKSPSLHLIVWLSIAVATVIGYGFWYHTVTSKSTAVAELQNQINVKAQTSVRVAAARAALAEISGDEALVQSYFVPETGVVSFIDDLESRAHAQTAAMKVLSVSTGGVAKQATSVLLLTVSIDGTFDAVMRTIGAVEYAPYDLSVSRLSITKDAKNAWHANIELIIGSVPKTDAATSTPAAPATVTTPSFL